MIYQTHTHPVTGDKIEVAHTDAYKEDIRQFVSEFKCVHPSTELRIKPTLGGGRQFRHQCLRCGASAGQAQKQSTIDDVDALTEFDPVIERAFQAEKDKSLGNLYVKHAQRDEAWNRDFKQRYRNYLRSDEWREKRTKVLKRCKGICEACAESEATQVHHLTYENVFEEPLFDLVGICAPCHKKLHKDANWEEFLEYDDLPCLHCRWYGFEDVADVRQCAKFEMSCSHALRETGPCGPNAEEHEGLR